MNIPPSVPMGGFSETSLPCSGPVFTDPVAVGLSDRTAGPRSPTGRSDMLKQQQQQQQKRPHKQQQYGSQQNAFSSQFDMAQSRGGAAFDMSSISNGLPQVDYRSSYPHNGSGGVPQLRYHPGLAVAQQHQYAVQGVPVPNLQYYVQQQPGMPYQYYAMAISQSAGNPQLRQNVGYYQGQMLVNHQQNSQAHSAYNYTPASPYPNQNQQSIMSQCGPNLPAQGGAGMHAQTSMGDMPLPAGSKSQASDGRPGSVRGPPRKPKQSGHAIWIGNLPPQTDLVNLVHHVCREAPGLESLFLISKSNCAFANFKDDQTCVSAQQRLHDSKFQSVRLVSRLRKSTVEGAMGVAAPTGPTGAISTLTAQAAPESSSEDSGESTCAEAIAQPAALKADPTGQSLTKDRFFILKSLTVDDLYLSVRNGIWATQSHNEETLNKAFKNADNVYLVFSANKSGEYFGYARMVSEINEDPAAAIEFAPLTQASDDADLPKAIPTQATEFAPKGRIIDDSARGTIFWEAEREDEVEATGNEEPSSETGSTKNAEADVEADGDAGAKAWGKPFQLEWLSTTRLPFYRTRGLRNPWNSNREVKIARDGTELEPSVGQRLIGLFNRVHSPLAAPAVMRPGVEGIMGYPPMRMFP